MTESSQQPKRRCTMCLVVRYFALAVFFATAVFVLAKYVTMR